MSPGRPEDEIRRRIAGQGALPFAAFMDLALYHPEGGYYVRPATTTGREGDFSTSPDVSPAFGRRLAVQVAELAERARGGRPWRLVEVGPGRGLLAVDLLEGLARHAEGILRALGELVLVELNPELARAQRERLAGVDAPPLRWVGEVGEAASAGTPVVVVLHEVLDALPVHLVERGEQGLLQETWVEARTDGRLRLRPGPLSDPRLAEIVERYQLCPRAGERAEVCLALEDLLDGLAGLGQPLAALVVDYGLPAERLGDPDHADGTLVAYHRHRVVEEVLARPGEQDLTAHVNWDHLRDAAAARGLSLAGPASQDRFLLRLGLLEDLVAGAGGREAPAAIAERLAARALVMPGPGGGRRFQAAVLSRGIDGPFRGFVDPPGGLAP
jgi:SAM-dependent MidA family methyltransferase